MGSYHTAQSSGFSLYQVYAVNIRSLRHCSSIVALFAGVSWELVLQTVVRGDLVGLVVTSTSWSQNMQTWTVPELRRRLAGQQSCVMFMTLPVCNIINLLDVTSCGQLIPAQLTDNVS